MSEEAHLDAVYNRATDEIDFVEPGGRAIYSLSGFRAAMLSTSIDRAQFTRFIYNNKKRTLDSGSSPE